MSSTVLSPHHFDVLMTTHDFRVRDKWHGTTVGMTITHELIKCLVKVQKEELIEKFYL